MLYKIAFTDATYFDGGTIKETKWLEVPKDKEIRCLMYCLPDGNMLNLYTYNQYFHMVEVTKDLTGKYAGNIKYHNIVLYCKKNNSDKVVKYKICLLNDKDKNIGDIQRTVIDYNNDEIKGLNPDGWIGLSKEDNKNVRTE